MKTIKQTINEFISDYPIEEKLAPREELLFLDIETTGFTARSSFLYLIGCSYYADGNWQTIQWLAQDYSEETQILTAFFDFATKYKYLVHFNGNNFDLPYLAQKCRMLNISYDLESFEGIDIYRRITPYKYFLKLPNCKQKSIEHFLGIHREDRYTGGELVSVYHDYVQAPTEEAEHSLLLHNQDDLYGMLLILPILSYHDLFRESVHAKRVQSESFRDINGITRRELLIELILPCNLPREITVSSHGCFFRGEGDHAVLKVPVFEEEMKYFYANYKNYYYLPEEDVALHKSVATFVDADHRIPATAETCYTRKASSYLPQWDIIFEPFFKRDYRSKELFFELTDEFKTDREAFHQYATYILHVMASTY